jgi:hypothetical protein
MIIWDANDTWALWRSPNSKCPNKCTICQGRLFYPFVAWFPTIRPGQDAFICNECCAEMCRGFSRDLRQIQTAKEVGRLGFRHVARRAAVSGGFLYTTKSNKQ